ncbi:hypothetical protein B0H17DRAFT_1147231 [Mycena rosella]|uniref:Uncharacterized protein n=1 Tax=Mycena rosella TaxID=1033263 RepID=A0AAD7CPI8_MYCRO|nr:hypothetical protein B0H17DRAFT_1147231 [Mycena rosella]
MHPSLHLNVLNALLEEIQAVAILAADGSLPDLRTVAESIWTTESLAIASGSLPLLYANLNPARIFTLDPASAEATIAEASASVIAAPSHSPIETRVFNTELFSFITPIQIYEWSAQKVAEIRGIATFDSHAWKILVCDEMGESDAPALEVLSRIFSRSDATPPRIAEWIAGAGHNANDLVTLITCHIMLVLAPKNLPIYLSNHSQGMDAGPPFLALFSTTEIIMELAGTTGIVPEPLAALQCLSTDFNNYAPQGLTRCWQLLTGLIAQHGI